MRAAPDPQNTAPTTRRTYAAACCALFAAAILFVPEVASAKCASSAVWFWPESGATIDANNALIVVNGYGQDEDRVFGLKKASLRGGNETIPLQIVGRRKGEMRISQVVLAPVKPLRAGVTYALQIGKAAGREIQSWRIAGEKAQWTAVEATSESFAWNEAPKVLRNSYAAFGCGPAANVIVELSGVAAADRRLFEVVVTQLGKSAAPRSYFLSAEKGLLHIGHDMCSGAFRLEPGAEYSAQISVIDGRGEKIRAPGELVFRGPSPADRE